MCVPDGCRKGVSVSMAVQPSHRMKTQAGLWQSVRDMLGPLYKEPPLPQQPDVGCFTDTGLRNGCKANEVACQHWKQLPASDPTWTGTSYDNTHQLSAI